MLEKYFKNFGNLFHFKCKTGKRMKSVFVFWFNEEANEKLSINFGL
jgi:hypothetical protein